jgi:hypothetical protein
MDTLALASPPVGGLQPAGGALDVDYRPGTCNIGAYEIARRRRSAYVGFAITAVLAAVLLAIDAPQLARVLVLFPLWGSITTYLQARRKFCVGFAFAGLENFGDEEAARRHVVDEDARSADRRMAMRMVRDGLFIAAPVTLLFVLLPV